MSARTFILLLAVATITTIGFVNTAVIAASPSDSNQQADANAKPPFRLAIAGLVHDHVTGLLKDIPHRKDFTLVGIAEPNAKLAATYAARYHIPQSIIYTDLNKMLDETKPQAVVIYTSTFDHLQVVQACTAHHIDVMMEKPLAVSIEHTAAIEQAAKKAGIRVFVNYSTTWEPVNTLLRDMVIEQKAIGDIRKIIFYKGHQGQRKSTVRLNSSTG